MTLAVFGVQGILYLFWGRSQEWETSSPGRRPAPEKGTRNPSER